MGKKDKIMKIFDKKLNFFSSFRSNFEADFGDHCYYYKLVTKILEIFMSPPIFFHKGYPRPPPHTQTQTQLLVVLMHGIQEYVTI